MTKWKTPAKVSRASEEIAAHLTAWRKLQGLTAAQVADRAGIARSTLSRLESGDPKVGFDVVLGVARALGILSLVSAGFDPYETDLGRARASQTLPQRVRR